MREKLEKVLRGINDLDELLWLLRGKAVEHKDRQLLEYVGSLNARLDKIFLHISEVKQGI